MLGKVEAGLIVNGPVPGMLKAMVSMPACALAAVIASRKVHSAESQTPVPGSAVELTVKVILACGNAAVGSAQAASSKAGRAVCPKSESSQTLLPKLALSASLPLLSYTCAAAFASTRRTSVCALLEIKLRNGKVIARIQTRR